MKTDLAFKTVKIDEAITLVNSTSTTSTINEKEMQIGVKVFEREDANFYSAAIDNQLYRLQHDFKSNFFYLDKLPYKAKNKSITVKKYTII